MAQQAIFRHAALEGGLKGIEVVNALARIGAFAKQVLIDIRDGGGIGINA